jgi:hypothetical protein
LSDIPPPPTDKPVHLEVPQAWLEVIEARTLSRLPHRSQRPWRDLIFGIGVKLARGPFQLHHRTDLVQAAGFLLGEIERLDELAEKRQAADLPPDLDETADDEAADAKPDDAEGSQ